MMPSKFNDLRHGVETGMGSYLVRFPNSVRQWTIVRFDHEYVVLEGVRHGSIITVKADQVCYVQHSFEYSQKSVDASKDMV